MPMNDGKNALDIVLDFHSKLDTIFLPEICFIALSHDNRTPLHTVEQLTTVGHTHTVLQHRYSHYHELIKSLLKLGQEHYAIVWSDTLFHSPELHSRMHERHINYNAHYTHSIGYPTHISPEYLSQEGLELIALLSDKTKRDANHNTSNKIGSNVIQESDICHESLFDSMQAQLNDFDIEVVLSPSDMRYHRLDVCLETRRGYVFSKQAYSAGLRVQEELESYVVEYPSALMSMPSYVQVQVTQSLEQENYLQPFSYDTSKNMSTAEFKTLCVRLQEYSDDMVLQLGFRGEFATHPDSFEILEIAQTYFKHIYMDTSGYLWNIQDEGWSRVDYTKITWIIEMDAYSESLYTKIHGDNFSHCHQFITFLERKVPKGKLYVQAQRLQENEHELGEFLEYWEKRGIKAIIKKYNSYSGILPERDSASIRPHVRLPCHHLSRDMHVLVDGSVIQCGQELNENNTLGNIFKEEVEVLYKKNTQRLLEHSQKKYHTICENCDEYYTVNV